MSGTRNPGAESIVTVAAVLGRSVTGETTAPVEAAVEAVHAAIDSGYLFDSRAEAFALSETIDGPTVSLWAEIARKRKVWIAGGCTVREGGRRRGYDSSLTSGAVSSGAKPSRAAISSLEG